VVIGLGVGLGIGVAVTLSYLQQTPPAFAASNDRYQDFAMATGAVSINPKLQTDGVWLLDYKSGKLLGTVVDKSQGRIMGWSEVDLVTEFDVQPKQDVHFMMVTGWISSGQSALYVAETTTGKFGVYTMGPGLNGQGVSIRRHDLTVFRQTVQPAAAQEPQPAPAPAAAPDQPAAAPTLPPTPLLPKAGS
jgi:hypothetical protein